ncbi:MAG: hypothetical protein LKG27_07650 [Clostridiaceae bacterium]|jgi:hypothetical protein|nr:hypothetical protein [Clostridiaceae bacterium]
MRNFLLALAIIFAIFIFNRTKENKAPRPYKTDTSNFSVKSPSYSDKIPDAVYENTSENDALFKVINSDKKIIYYAYANCPIGQSIKYNIQAGLDKESLNFYYNFYPDLQGASTLVSCKNGTNLCAQYYLFDNCGDKVCIIHPKRREIVKINNGDFAEIIRKAIYLKNW